MKMYGLGVLALCGVANAVVAPEGTVQDSLCGNLNKSVQLCVSDVEGSGNAYFMLRHFMKGTKAIPVRNVEPNKLSDELLNKTVVLKGAYVPESTTSSYNLESKYELKLTKTADGFDAIWSVDGKAQGPAIPMEWVASIALSP